MTSNEIQKENTSEGNETFSCHTFSYFLTWVHLNFKNLPQTPNFSPF